VNADSGAGKDSSGLVGHARFPNVSRGGLHVVLARVPLHNLLSRLIHRHKSCVSKSPVPVAGADVRRGSEPALLLQHTPDSLNVCLGTGARWRGLVGHAGARWTRTGSLDTHGLVGHARFAAEQGLVGHARFAAEGCILGSPGARSTTY